MQISTSLNYFNSSKNKWIIVSTERNTLYYSNSLFVKIAWSKYRWKNYYLNPLMSHLSYWSPESWWILMIITTSDKVIFFRNSRNIENTRKSFSRYLFTLCFSLLRFLKHSSYIDEILSWRTVKLNQIKERIRSSLQMRRPEGKEKYISDYLGRDKRQQRSKNIYFSAFILTEHMINLILNIEFFFREIKWWIYYHPWIRKDDQKYVPFVIQEWLRDHVW